MGLQQSAKCQLAEWQLSKNASCAMEVYGHSEWRDTGSLELLWFCLTFILQKVIDQYDTQRYGKQLNNIPQNDIQQNDTQQNDTQQNDIQKKEIQKNETQQNDIQQNDT